MRHFLKFGYAYCLFLLAVGVVLGVVYGPNPVWLAGMVLTSIVGGALGLAAAQLAKQ